MDVVVEGGEGRVANLPGNTQTARLDDPVSGHLHGSVAGRLGHPVAVESPRLVEVVPSGVGIAHNRLRPSTVVVDLGVLDQTAPATNGSVVAVDTGEQELVASPAHSDAEAGVPVAVVTSAPGDVHVPPAGRSASPRTRVLEHMAREGDVLAHDLGAGGRAPECPG